MSIRLGSINLTGGAPGTDGKSAYQYAVEGGYTGTEAQFMADIAKAGIYNQEDIEITLTASAWTGSSEAWTQTVTATGVTATSLNYITTKVGATAEERTAFGEAELQDGGQAANSITLISASSDKPTEDIYCRVVILKVVSE